MNAEIDPGRLARAIHLDCQRVKPDVWLVSGAAADHTVEVVAGGVRCGCMDSTVRGPGCKHELAVRLHAGDPEVVLALRRLVAPPRRLRRVA